MIIPAKKLPWMKKGWTTYVPPKVKNIGKTSKATTDNKGIALKQVSIGKTGWSKKLANKAKPVKKNSWSSAIAEWMAAKAPTSKWMSKLKGFRSPYNQ